jgi:uncharacterized protein YggT (Ycf19 family)
LPEPIYILVQFIIVFIDVITIAMCIRAVLSWFYDGDGAFVRLLYFITEPAILPIRKLLVKMNWLQNSPMDFSFLLTYIALFIIQALLSSLI